MAIPWFPQDGNQVSKIPPWYNTSDITANTRKQDIQVVDNAHYITPTTSSSAKFHPNPNIRNKKNQELHSWLYRLPPSPDESLSKQGPFLFFPGLFFFLMPLPSQRLPLKKTT